MVKIEVKLICIAALMSTAVFAQNSYIENWYDGNGTAAGSDIEKIHAEALNRARSDALKKAGIEVTSGTLLLKSGGENKLIDFFSEFVETNSRGLILDERVSFEKPEPVDSSYTVYRLTAHVHALVGLQKGEPDPSFEVKLLSDRNTYSEYEPATITVKTTKPGYLTILDVHGDSMDVLFPNSIDRNNYISPNTEFVFPPTRAYTLTFETEKGEVSSTDMIIAVVTTDSIPFPNIQKRALEGSKLTLAKKPMTSYARWLLNIPSNRRCLDWKLIQVEKKMH